jgi:hypothetical protein
MLPDLLIGSGLNQMAELNGPGADETDRCEDARSSFAAPSAYFSAAPCLAQVEE